MRQHGVRALGAKLLAFELALIVLRGFVDIFNLFETE